MNRTTVGADALRRASASIGAGALALVLLAIAAGPASAAPHLRARVFDGNLLISGSPFADQITLRLSATVREQLEVDLDNDGSADATFDLTNIDAIDVDAAGGDDTVRIDDVNGVLTTPTRIDGGNGDDTLNGGGGAEILVGGNGNDRIDGNGGADTAFLGRGDDTFVWDPGDASDVVEGGSGSDTMVFNGSGGNEIMAASAVFGRVSFTRNLGTIAMDLNGIEAIDVRALGGTDTVTVNDVTGTDLNRVNVDLASTLGGSTGDGLDDTVAVNGTKGDDSIAAVADGAAIEVRGLSAEVRVTHADPARDTLVIDPVTGDNKVSVDPAVKDLIQVSVL
jgi:Ca2+-binding RTX toxin-like protein